jgi:rSAM/selenodomain-associated transferase 2
VTIIYWLNDTPWPLTCLAIVRMPNQQTKWPPGELHCRTPRANLLPGRRRLWYKLPAPLRRMKPVVSIIIPTLNEAHLIVATLDAIGANTAPHEVIAVDGGSSDGTTELAEKRSDRLLRAAARNRATQMNEGRRLAKGDALLFLHADTLIAPVALEKIAKALSRREIVGGAFARRYASQSIFLRITCLLAELRGKMFGWFLGDQAMFVRTEVFDALGGFKEWEIFEDLDFSRRMKRIGRVMTLRPPVVTSARRFSSRGAVGTTLSDLWLTCRYVVGKPPHLRGCINNDSSCRVIQKTSAPFR